MTVNVSKPVVNVREKLAELDKPTGIAGEAMLRAETPQEQFNLIGAGRRNWIINGNHIVNQRGSLPVSGMGENSYQNTDRWRSRVGGVTANSALVSNTGFKSLKSTATSTGTGIYYIGFDQKVEDLDQFKGKWVTFSAKVRSNSPHACLLFGGLGIGDDTVFHSGSGEWETLTLPYFVTEAASGYPLMHILIYTGGSINISSGDYIEFTDAQLEVGKVATPFEHRSYGEELALCQRYFYRMNGPLHAHPCWQYGSNQVSTTFKSPVTMRTTPTFTRQGTLQAGSVTNGTSYYSNNAWLGLISLSYDSGGSNPDAFRIDAGTVTNHSNSSGAGGMYIGNSPAAFDFDAEL